VNKPALPERLAFLLETVEREKHHLQITTDRLFSQEINASWVERLDENVALSEQLDAFVARFGRLQDTLADKLIPELIRQLAETPKSSLDNLNRMEKLGLLSSVDDWLEARNLRNRLIHECLRDAVEFAQALTRGSELVPLLTTTQQTIDRYAKEHWT
jgi:hypothetical protein